MNEAIGVLTAVSGILRTLVLAGGLVFAGVALVDWAVRTRRISPFSGIARFMRTRVEPRIAGVERQVARAGGHPSSTPWWALVVYIVAALLLIAAFDILVSLLDEVSTASSRGATGLLVLLVGWTFAFLRFALLVRIIASWLPGLSTRRWISWSFGATEWMLRPLRNVIPSLGVIDITPIVAYFALQFAQWVIEKVLFAGLR
jgi:YggT family protein